MSGASSLIQQLRSLKPTGANGFEGLVADLLSRLTNYRFFLAASGRQEGRDMRAPTEYGTHIAVECKRYGRVTELNERELVAEFAQAAKSLPQLDLWVLVASRPVPDGLEQQLRTQADEAGVAFALLDWLEDDTGTLAVLCAEFQDQVLARLPAAARRKARQVLKAIRSDERFAAALAGLRKEFSQAWIGFDQARRESHSWLKAHLASESESKFAFSQYLVVAKALPRVRLLERVTAWFAKEDTARRPLIVLGEEGDGKTWLIADWIFRKLEEAHFPLVLLLPSSFVTDTDAGSLLAKALTRISLGVGEDLWLRRLRRWTDFDDADSPRIMLVLDGVNEKFAPSHWRRLFACLDMRPWRALIQLIITCRTTYWDRQLSTEFGTSSERLYVTAYDDAELQAALGRIDLSRSDLSPAILPLIRKPRYFDLVVRHRQNLKETGDITVSRLLYEDWRDRYERHLNLPLSGSDFNDWLKRIANRAYVGEREVQMAHVQADLPPLDDQARRELFAELVSGGVLDCSAGGRFAVAPVKLLLGLGLLLVDRLREPAAGGNLTETISGWLEPAGGIDDKATILEQAALHALILPDVCDEIRVALLAAWLRLQNRNDPECKNFVRYLPQRPAAFFKLASELWSSGSDNPWGQQLLLEGVLRWRNVARVASEAISYASGWLGYVQACGQPVVGGRVNKLWRRSASRTARPLRRTSRGDGSRRACRSDRTN